MRDSADPLDWMPQRILVAGVAGAGKTTLARRVEAITGLPHTEIDGLYHGSNWQPRESFMAEVEAFTAELHWVTEWQYRSVRPLWTFFTDKDHIVRWSIRTRAKYRALMENVQTEHPQLHVVRLRSRRAVDEWLDNLRAGQAEA